MKRNLSSYRNGGHAGQDNKIPTMMWMDRSSESKKQMCCFFFCKKIKKFWQEAIFCPLKPVISEGIFSRKSRKGGDNQ